MKRRISFAQRQVRARPLACFAVCFLLGLIATRRLRPPLIACIIACVVLLTLALALKLVRRRGAAAIVLLLAFALGVTRMTLAQRVFPVVETRYSSRMTG